MTDRDTIYALASARGRAGVSVIRISGRSSDDALTALGVTALPDYRTARVRRLIDPTDGSVLDDALVLRFAVSASFTGEASVEIQCHGGPAVVAAILAALSAVPSLRMASPGEFTRRAFDNGRLDLAQIEGLSDLIAAETEAQRRAALRQADGSLGRAVRDWSDKLTTALALLEATIDFADEDIPDETYDIVSARVFHVKQSIAALLENAQFSERYRDGWRVAVIGAPNAGKSSLLNALARRDVAITSPVAGTTRDAIEVALDFDGYPVTVVDTAGLRQTADSVEIIGMDRAQLSAKTADLRVALVAPDAPLTATVRDLLADTDLIVWNKSDIEPSPRMAISISTATGDGLPGLIDAIQDRLDLADPSGASALLRDRHDAALRETISALTRYESLATNPAADVGDTPEIAAEHLRVARASLGTITGDVGVERLLDVIFSEFCLGK